MYIVNKINEGNRGKKYVMSKEKNYEKLLADYVVLRQSEENQIFADGVHLAHQLMQECYR